MKVYSSIILMSMAIVLGSCGEDEIPDQDDLQGEWVYNRVVQEDCSESGEESCTSLFISQKPCDGSFLCTHESYTFDGNQFVRVSSGAIFGLDGTRIFNGSFEIVDGEISLCVEDEECLSFVIRRFKDEFELIAYDPMKECTVVKIYVRK